MKTIRRGYYFILSPIILSAAVVLFILDNFNVNVTGVSSYTLKESKK